MNYANYDNLLALMPQLAAKVGSSIVPWQENTLYSQGQVVLYDYNLYQCTVAHTSTSTFDDTKFHIIGGGDSSSSGVNAVADTLWTGTLRTINTTITLAKAYTDYDYLIFSSAGHGTSNTIALPEQITQGSLLVFSAKNNHNEEMSFTVVSATQLTLSTFNDYSGGDFALTKIVGIKFLNPNVYSTAEQRIGTWIDGKPLYQITGSGSVNLTANTWTDLFTIPNVDTLGWMEGAFDGEIIDSSLIRKSIISGGIVVQGMRPSSATTSYCITIKYTKTTD